MGIPTAAPAWVRTNPGGGGAFNAALILPHGPWFVASDLSGLYRSLDRGRSWRPIGALHGLTETHVSALAADPAGGVFAGTEAGLFVSHDGGEHWARVPGVTGYVSAVAFAPEGRVGYLAVNSRYDRADARVYRTTDGGRHWTRVAAAGWPARAQVVKLLVPEARSGRVFALLGEGRFACSPAGGWVSDDAGRSWRPFYPALGQVADVALVRDTVYLATYGDVWDPGYRCVHDDRAGGHLYRIEPERAPQLVDPPAAPRNLLLWPDPRAAQRLRALDMDARELWLTEDAGRSWRRVARRETWALGWTDEAHAYGLPFQGDAYALAIDPSDPNVALWVDSQFVWRTEDGGRTFEPAHTRAIPPAGWRSRGVDNVVPLALALDADGQHVYAGYADLGCWRSPDRGARWLPCNDPRATGDWGAVGGNAPTILADPDVPGRVWVALAPDLGDAASFALLWSDDFAATWHPARGDWAPGPLTGLSLDPHSPRAARRLWVAARDGVYTSADGGRSWARALAQRGLWVTAVGPEGTVYAAGAGGVWVQRPGHEWQRTWALPGDARSAWWQAAYHGVSALRPDPSVPGRVWAVVHGPEGGLYRSDDLGRHWVHVWAHPWAWDVLPLPDGALLLASSSARMAGGFDPGSRGVLLSRDGGRGWTSLATGWAWPFAVALAWEDGALWAASPGLGLLTRPWP